MDLFILDELLRRTAVVDQYESLIWTERYSAHGDFELVIRSERGFRQLFMPGTMLAIKHSFRVMVVETVTDGTNEDGIATLNISGRSIETILMDRAATPGLVDMTANPKWVITGRPGDIAWHIFYVVCVVGTISENDKIPFWTQFGPWARGTIEQEQNEYTIEFDPDTVYASIKSVCDLFDLGFRLIRNGDNSQLVFDIYTGDDHTTLQTVNKPVVFSPELDNLTDTTELRSTADYKNVAYVYGKNASAVAYANDITESVTGFERRVLVVKADDIDLPVGEELDAALIQRGKEELSKHRAVIAFDGKTPQFGSYEYEVDYRLGDLVELRGSDGVATNMRVTEQIFVSDVEGFRAYPTLSIELLITPGSWLGWNAGQVWVDAPGEWIDA